MRQSGPVNRSGARIRDRIRHTPRTDAQRPLASPLTTGTALKMRQPPQSGWLLAQRTIFDQVCANVTTGSE